MAGRTHFFSTFAIILLTLGIISVVDARAAIGIFVTLVILFLMLAVSLFFGPVE